MNERIHALVETIWHYHQLNHELARADAILVLCSHDRRVAECGARLWLEGWAPLLIFSGGLGSITSRLWSEPEADQFAAVARAMGVPDDRILVNASTNTGENILFTRQLLAASRDQSAQLHRGAEAVHGTAKLCDLPQVVARGGRDRHIAAGHARRISRRLLPRCPVRGRSDQHHGRGSPADSRLSRAGDFKSTRTCPLRSGRLARS